MASAITARRVSISSHGSVFGSPNMTLQSAPKRPSISSQGSVFGSPKMAPKSARPSVSSHGSLTGSPNIKLKSMSIRPSVSSQGSVSSVMSSMCSSVEDLSASMDSLDLLCIDDTMQSEDQIQTVLYRLLMDMEKLKKKVHFFKKNYSKLEKKNEILERQNNVLHGHIVKYQCDTDRLCKENERLKEKLRKLQDDRIRDVRQMQIHDVQPCAVISEDYVYV